MTYPPTAGYQPPQQHVPPVNYHCHNCGNALSSDAQFCGRCGTPRQATIVATGPLTAPYATTPTATAAKTTRPTVVNWAVVLLFAYALSVAANGVFWGVRDGHDPSKGVIVALAVAIPAIFVYMGKRAARIIAWVVAGLFLPTTLATILDAGATSAIAYPLAYLLDLVAVIVLLAMPASNAYFRKAPATATASSVRPSSPEPTQQAPAPGKPARTPMSGALKLLIVLGAVVVLVAVAAIAANLRNAGGGSSEAGAGQPDWTPTTPEQVACAAVRDEVAAGTLFNRSSQHARDIHTKVIDPLMGSAGTNSNFRRQQLIVAFADWQAYVGNDSNRLTPAQILAELDGQCSSYGAPIGA
jgi:hypothetical protein